MATKVKKTKPALKAKAPKAKVSVTAPKPKPKPEPKPEPKPVVEEEIIEAPPEPVKVSKPVSVPKPEPKPEPKPVPIAVAKIIGAPVLPEELPLAVPVLLDTEQFVAAVALIKGHANIGGRRYNFEVGQEVAGGVLRAHLGILEKAGKVKRK